MTKMKLLIGATIALVLGVFFVGVVAAQEVPPPPYAGLKNPFAWDDAAAQTAGKTIYQQSCLGCHGVKGDGVRQSNFSAADFGDHLEQQPDVHFWLLSEGRLNQGMPPFKAPLSEEKRWQVLTYIRLLGKASSTAPPASQPAPEAGSLALTVPEQGRPGEVLTLTATLLDNQGQPIQNETVNFLISADFFATAQMGIGEATTNDRGVAVVEYIPRLSGERNISARYRSVEAVGTITLAESEERFYEPEAGIKLPALGPRVFVGPQSALHLGEMGAAPTSALYLPGGVLSWLLLVVAAIVLVWFSYFRVMRQISGIPIAGDIREIDTRLVPRMGLIYVVTLGILLALKLVIGPYSHFHLLR
jgi:mono/diheme cytochrome c family protein